MTDHIKVYGVKPRIQYIANGSSTAYEFPFVIFKASDIDVYLNDTKQADASFTVSGVRNSDGGTVTFGTAPTSGTVVSIVRNLSIERTSDFQEGGALRANVLNDELDYQMACQQQIADNLNRSMVLPPYAVDSGVNLTLPTPSAGKAIVWNTDGTNLENSTVAVNALESTLKGYKNVAEAAATTATTQAGIASDKADIATAKAQIATDKATEAATTLASKLNANMDNISSAGKAVIAGLGMPDYSAGVSVSLTTTGIVFTPTLSGIVKLGRSYADGTKKIEMYYGTDDTGIKLQGYVPAGQFNTGYEFCDVPVVKGDNYFIITNNVTTCSAVFYPLKGVVNA